jgi:hypothetical protein
MRHIRLVLPLIAVATFARPAHAQRGGDGFVFRRPEGSIAFRIGYDHALAGSDIFGFTTSQLTLGKSAFSSFALAVEAALWVTPQVDIALGVGYAGSDRASEFRGYLDNNNLPIQQSTAFTRVPVSVSVRYHFRPSGRAIGTLAWVPTPLVPYVGFGVGREWYAFRQEGDFIDFSTLAVFPDRYSSTGWTEEVHAVAGAALSLNTRFALTGELRYTWARAPMNGDFVGFQKIDLSGVSLTTGLAFRL